MKNRVITLFLIICIISVPVMALAESSSDVVIDETVLEPKDPILSTVIAIGPGLLVHGFGHLYCEDYKMGLLFTGLELLSIGAMCFGYVQNTTPELLHVYGGDIDEGRRAGALTFGTGFLLFVGTWLADILLAGKAAGQYNKEHNLEFKLQQESLLKGGADSTYAALYKFNF
jgi:hypothetical protein